MPSGPDWNEKNEFLFNKCINIIINFTGNEKAHTQSKTHEIVS